MKLEAKSAPNDTGGHPRVRPSEPRVERETGQLEKQSIPHTRLPDYIPGPGQRNERRIRDYSGLEQPGDEVINRWKHVINKRLTVGRPNPHKRDLRKIHSTRN